MPEITAHKQHDRPGQEFYSQLNQTISRVICNLLVGFSKTECLDLKFYCKLKILPFLLGIITLCSRQSLSTG